MMDLLDLGLKFKKSYGSFYIIIAPYINWDYTISIKTNKKVKGLQVV